MQNAEALAFFIPHSSFGIQHFAFKPASSAACYR
jgi:hypothetical protein